MEIKTEDYSIWYEPETATVTCQGSLRLSGMDEYAPLVQLLSDAIDKQPPQLALNLQELDFLNSSGINVLSKFVIKVRQNGKINLVVRGSKNIPWQGKSLKNLQRLMPSLQLELE
ncbi:MAG: hypothetical protein KME26_29560 [Oscillatoria princeps RMCB-10]|jgi:hypothetical protein|nr:hypothetical protein [Oscillatoria princeps RMCB-10]